MTEENENSVTTQAQARVIAEGIKIALRELAEHDQETLKAFLAGIWEIWSDGANRWLGSKAIVAIGAALLTAGAWLVGGGWRK